MCLQTYCAYHENPYLDEETKASLLKGRFELTAKHRCLPITHKPFFGEVQ
jgi:hypothetical protein